MDQQGILSGLIPSEAKAAVITASDYMQGGAAAVAQQEGLLVPNGAAGSQSTSPSPVGYGSGYGSGSTPGYGTTPTYGTSSPSYRSGYGAANSPPAYGYGSNSAPAYGSNTGTTPSYGSTTGSNTYSSSPAYGASSSSSVPGTVTAYNQGQAYGSTQQSNTSGEQRSGLAGPPWHWCLIVLLCLASFACCLLVLASLPLLPSSNMCTQA